MNLENWISQARRHWKEFQPTRYEALLRAGILESELRIAAERTHDEMSAFEQNGFTTHEAWERVREEYLFPPQE
ncbi:MAG: hypothetical protein EKK29_18155 [Hyphomicrobiales bacterium]|nr:MAG: hypothetical protein EKK29_18155 [Hyphomicrobiales bacterium]